MRADLFIITLVLSTTFGLIWAWLQSAGNTAWASVFLALYLIATTVLFASIALREWGEAALWPSRVFGVLAAAPVFTGLYSYSLGFATMLGALKALQARRTWLAILLSWTLAVTWNLFPVGFAYDPTATRGWTWAFISNLLYHWFLPFLSLFLVAFGGWAIGMRNMIIYELESDYAHYLEALGAPQRLVRKYAFRNAVLPQITGLALSLGAVIAGALVTEIVTSLRRGEVGLDIHDGQGHTPTAREPPRQSGLVGRGRAGAVVPHGERVRVVAELRRTRDDGRGVQPAAQEGGDRHVAHQVGANRLVEPGRDLLVHVARRRAPLVREVPVPPGREPACAVPQRDVTRLELADVAERCRRRGDVAQLEIGVERLPVEHSARETRGH